MTTLETASDQSEHAEEPDAAAADTATTDARMLTLPLASLAPHPDNPRSDLGDLTEIERSIKANGVLVPLLVLPEDDSGVHLIVAGHRRHAASLRAGVEEVPAVVRPMTRVEAIEAMLTENVNRDALTVADEVRAIERLMSLDGALTPAKLCRRIGKSQAWVRARMAVTILPAQWRAAIDTGQLSLAAAEAAATAADLGPDHLDAICERLVRHRWGDPAREVENYRAELRRQEAYTKAVEVARRGGGTVYTDDETVPKRAKRVDELFNGADRREDHASEPCHAVVIKPVGWGDGIMLYEICAEPHRHSPKRVESGKGSALASDRPRPVDTESSNAKRKGRLARLAHATEHFGKARGGPSQAELVRLALLSLVLEAGREPLRYAAMILGKDKTNVSPADLLDGVETPGALARVAGAVACGLAEDDMYWAASSAQCTAWLDLLCRSGWVPDEWTATIIARRDQRLAQQREAANGGNDDASSQALDLGPHDGEEPREHSTDLGDEVGEHSSPGEDGSSDEYHGVAESGENVADQSEPPDVAVDGGTYGSDAAHVDDQGEADPPADRGDIDLDR